ncbi:MAG: anaerobic ribonucleoside-triphosphate reductase activating protein [Ruminococcus sp.]|nr:anaerobic ribonucleoside-triphosphate reductase activating protein [Ruminococcus sp.]HAE52281.1 anaerobic ribonucleoside-triphosphate reductase activating protein [Ruminococcus sp.]
MKIRIAGTVNDSIVDGEGIRFTIFVQGCPHHCEGCQNPQTHDFNGGMIVDTDELLEKIKNNPLLDGVTFSGGEPFCHAAALADMGRKIKAMGLDIITYTGYTFEELYANRDKNNWGELLDITDYLVDGKFELSLKSYNIRFRGSTNQRYLNCKESIKTGKAIKYL